MRPPRSVPGCRSPSQGGTPARGDNGLGRSACEWPMTGGEGRESRSTLGPSKKKARGRSTPGLVASAIDRFDRSILVLASMTSPPLRVTRPRRVTMFTVSLMKRTLPSPKRQLMPPEWNENSSSLAPALLPAVTPGSSARGSAPSSGGTCCRGCPRRRRRCPARPSASSGGSRRSGPAGPLRRGGRRRRGALGVGAEEPLVAAGVLADGDRVAGAVGALRDPGHALLEQAEARGALFRNGVAGKLGAACRWPLGSMSV